MLDYFCIFTRGGFVLWTFQLTALKGSPIDALIQHCLLQERSGERSFQYSKDSAAYTLKWTFHNDLGLVFVAVYQRMLQLLYVDELLEAVKSEFGELYTPKRLEYPEFGDTFRQLMREAEERAKELKRPKQVTNFEDTKKGKQMNKESSGVASNARKGAGALKDAKGGKQGSAANGSAHEGHEDVEGDGSGSGSGGEEHDGGEGAEGGESTIPSGVAKSTSNAFDVSKLRQRKAGRGKGAAAAATKGHAASAVAAPGGEDAGGKKKGGPPNRAMRKWGGKEEEPQMKDFSKKPDEEALKRDVVDVAHAERSKVDEEEEDEEDGEYEDEEEEEGDGGGAPNGVAKAPAAKASGGWLNSIFQSVAGKATLEAVDLEPSLLALKQRLMSKNVAEEIAEKLCRSVETSLVGRKQGSFTRVSTVVKAAMEEALGRILTPRRSVDILRDVQTAKEQGRPYVVVFVGVNGVGKSTNLAKVAYWLTQHDNKVMLAACDTFRAGAVEQLRTHARRLQIPIFEKGYEKDPAAVAKEAIKEAHRTGAHAVLVDTAGRMQDNEPLMRALSKLINLNEPDLVLFVGEALVGNDAVDQLSKFNQRLADLSTAPEPRSIDGILLTKFDTIDDKVGAALSMVYISGAPIVFVGCGQTYTDLRRLNPKQIIRTLLQ